METKEQWTQIEDLQYEVSTDGRVRRMPGPNSPKGRILKQQVYARVPLSDRSRKRNGLVHKLVARAFLGQMPTPEHTQVNHINGDTTDNRVENLEWATRRENQLHAINEGLYGGRGEKHARAKLTDAQVSEIRRSYTGAYGEQTAIAKKHGVTQSLVSKIIKREIWGHLDDDDPSNVKVGRQCRITHEDVAEIRGKYTGERGQKAKLAREYRVSQAHIGRVIKEAAADGG